MRYGGNWSKIIRSRENLNCCNVHWAQSSTDGGVALSEGIFNVRCVAEHIDESIRVVQIGEALGINENYLTGLFHKYEGITLQHYIRKEKVRQAKELLLYSSYSCSEIAALLCFSTQSHFSSVFKREVGMTPAKYRESKIQRG